MVNSRTGHDAVPSLPSASQLAQTGASRPIKWSILWPFVLVLLFVIAAFLSAVYLEQRRIWGHELDEWSTLVDRLVATRENGGKMGRKMGKGKWGQTTFSRLL